MTWILICMVCSSKPLCNSGIEQITVDWLRQVVIHSSCPALFSNLLVGQQKVRICEIAGKDEVKVKFDCLFRKSSPDFVIYCDIECNIECSVIKLFA